MEEQDVPGFGYLGVARLHLSGMLASCEMMFSINWQGMDQLIHTLVYNLSKE